MSKRLLHLVCACVLTLTTLSLKAQLVPEKLPVLLINEVHNEDYLNDDVFIELLVIKSNEILHDVSKSHPKIIIDDSNSGSGLKSGFLAIKPEAIANAKPGDLILLYGSNTDISGANSNTIKIDINGPNVEKYEGFPNSTNSTYAGASRVLGGPTTLKDFISFTGPGDKIQVRVNEVYVNSIDQTHNKNYSLNDYGPNSGGALNPSAGVGNCAPNVEFMDDLSNKIDLDISCEQHTERSAAVKILSGNPPYNLTVNGELIEENGEPKSYSGSNIIAYGLQCGQNNLKITDDKGNTKSCNVYLQSNQNDLTLEHCPKENFDLKSEICEDLGSDCILIRRTDLNSSTLISEKSYTSFQSIPDFYNVQNDQEFHVSMSNSNGKIVFERKIILKVIIPGMPCNDFDSCNGDSDEYDNNCNCRGQSQPEFVGIEIIEGQDCEGERRLRVTNPFQSYTWYRNGKEVGYDREILASHGFYKVYVESHSGCLFQDQISLWDAESEPLTGVIESSGDVICSANDPVHLMIPSHYEVKDWHPNPSQLLENEHHAIITKPGIYTVEYYNEVSCLTEASIEISSALGDPKIDPKVVKLCDDTKLEVEGLDPNDRYSFTWIRDGVVFATGSTNVLEVDDIGEYSVLIASNQNECTAQLDAKVELEFSQSEIANILIDNGFVEYLVTYSKQVSSNGGGSSSRCTECCELEYMDDVGHEVILEGETVNVEIYMDGLVDQACTCSQNYRGLFVSDFCTLSLDDFLEWGEVNENVLKGYMNPTTVGETTSLFIYDPSCPKLYNDKESFLDLFSDLICAVHDEGQTTLKLDYDWESNSNNTSWGINMFFDGNSYALPDIDGLWIKNFKVGELVETSGIPENCETVLDKLCFITSQNYLSPTYVAGEFLTYSFQYKNLPDQFTLDLIINKDDKEAFEQLFGPQLKTIAEYAIDLAIQDGDLTRVEVLPACLMTRVCDLLNGPIKTSDDPSKALFNILDVKDPDIAKDIITCFDDNKLTYHYDVNYNLGLKYYDLLYQTSLVTQDLNHVDTPENEDNFILLGHTGIFSKKRYQAQMGSELLTASHGTPEPNGVLIQDQIKSFRYFDTYNVKVGYQFDFLPGNQREAKKHRINSNGEFVNLRVPGIYIKYAIEQNKKDEKIEDAWNFANVAAFAFGVGEATAAVRAGIHFGRLGVTFGLNNLRAALGTAEAFNAAAHIMLDESALCEKLNKPGLFRDTDFCNRHKDLVLFSDYLLMAGAGGLVALNRYAKTRKVVHDYRNKKTSTPAAQDEKIKNALGDEEFEAFKIMYYGARANGNIIRKALDAFPDGKQMVIDLEILDPNFFKKLEGTLYFENRVNRIAELAEAIASLGTDKGKKFLQLLKDPPLPLYEGSLVTNSHLLTSEDIVKGFGRVDHLEDVLHNDFNVIREVSGWEPNQISILGIETARLPGLADELTQFMTYIGRDKIKIEHYGIWYFGKFHNEIVELQFSIAGITKRTGSPFANTSFKEMVDNTTGPASTGRYGDLILGDESAGTLGKAFDEIIENNIVSAWNSVPQDFSSIPNPLGAQLLNLKQQDYECFVQATVTNNGRSPRPDFLFVRKDGNSLDFEDVIYLDTKYLWDTDFTTAQKSAITSFMKNGNSVDVILSAGSTSIDGTTVVLDQIITIHTYGKIATDNSLNLRQLIL